MIRPIRSAAMGATLVILAGCATVEDEPAEADTQGARAEAAARTQAEEDAKSRLCGSLRDPEVRDARGC